MKIVAGTTTERKERGGVMFIMIAVFGLWFGYDGLVGYPHGNLEKSLEDTAQRPDPPPEINHKVTSASQEAVEQHRSLAKVVEAYGPPGHREKGKVFYFAPGGLLTFRVADDGDRIRGEVEWKPGEHTEMDLILQKVLGGCLLALAVVYGLHLLFNVFLTRFTLDEGGVKLNRSPKVPWEAMTELKSDEYRERGYMDLMYEGDVGKGYIRLDDYKVASFREIITAICKAKNWENPLPPSEDDAPPTEQ